MRWGLALASLLCTLAPTVTPLHAQDPERQRVAEKLVDLAGLDSIISQTFATGFDQLVAKQPALAPYRITMDQFVAQYLPWNLLRPRIAALYAQAFTTSELQDLVAFYRTPTGQKAASTLPALMTEAGQLGQTLVQEHMADLQEMIAQRTKAIQDSVAAIN